MSVTDTGNIQEFGSKAFDALINAVKLSNELPSGVVYFLLFPLFYFSAIILFIFSSIFALVIPQMLSISFYESHIFHELVSLLFLDKFFFFFNNVTTLTQKHAFT